MVERIIRIHYCPADGISCYTQTHFNLDKIDRWDYRIATKIDLQVLFVIDASHRLHCLRLITEIV